MENSEEIRAINALVEVNEMIQERNYATTAKFFNDLYSLVSSKMKNSLVIPEEVESSYVGVHINEIYEESDLLKMIEGFRTNQLIHAKYAMKILTDAIKNFEN